MLDFTVTSQLIFQYSNMIPNFIPLLMSMFLRRLQRRTPYRTGLLRSSWEIEELTSGFRIYNPQPYTARIEYDSWSRQAPNGMLRITIDDIPKMIKEIVGAEFRRKTIRK